MVRHADTFFTFFFNNPGYHSMWTLAKKQNKKYEECLYNKSIWLIKNQSPSKHTFRMALVWMKWSLHQMLE